MPLKLFELLGHFAGEARELPNVGFDSGGRRPGGKRPCKSGGRAGEFPCVDAGEVLRRRALRYIPCEQLALSRKRPDLLRVAFERVTVDRATVAAGKNGRQERNGEAAPHF